VFIPRPAVESVLVAITRRDRPAVDPDLVPAGELFALVRAGFGQRRKMLRKSLEGLVGAAEFECAQVAPTSRAEELDVAAWGRLAACRRGNGPAN
jgi:16S rRNA (adenine1518-N6/adenine1519-N6)-dimethyltransferase